MEGNIVALLTSGSLSQAPQEGSQSGLLLGGCGAEKLCLPHERQLVSSLQAEAVRFTVLAELSGHHLQHTHTHTGGRQSAAQELHLALIAFKQTADWNLDAKSDGLHDEHSIREDSRDFLHTGEILHGIPDVSVFIQQLELPCGEAGQDKEVKGEGMKEDP